MSHIPNEDSKNKATPAKAVAMDLSDTMVLFVRPQRVLGDKGRRAKLK